MRPLDVIKLVRLGRLQQDLEIADDQTSWRNSVCCGAAPAPRGCGQAQLSYYPKIMYRRTHNLTLTL